MTPDPIVARRTGQRLTVRERLRRRPEFERVYSQGARLHGRFMTVLVLPNSGAEARLGVAATRRIGSAAERNRAKRLAREVFRRQKVASGLDIIVVPRREMLDAPFASLETDYRALLGRYRRDREDPGRSRRSQHRPRTAPGL